MNDFENAHTPKILAPAGNADAFLAALAAGADAVYCGMKEFSARMAAKNFDINDLARLTALAHEKGTEVYVALNSLLKPGELSSALDLIRRLARSVRPDALIVQDLAAIELARQADFSGEIHLSTLANCAFPTALRQISRMDGANIRRVVMPRELSIDEIRRMADACPEGIGLEVFIHGALCYAVSGRCYWSSYMGGKSSLRGRCVQPCRRVYRQGEKSGRFFSCLDLSVDVLTKVLKSVPRVTTWKIEGRKKSAHYVYYTVTAYRMLRDEGDDPRAKKDAVSLLERSLGRIGTHFRFLPQRPQNPVAGERRKGSGLYVGTVKGGAAAPYLTPREELLNGDQLRVGYEDEPWHSVVRVETYIPRSGRLELPKKGERAIPKNTPVFLTDRSEPALKQRIDALADRLEKISIPTAEGAEDGSARLRVAMPEPYREKRPTADMEVFRKPARTTTDKAAVGYWLSEHILANTPKKAAHRIWWWLPPVIWPEEAAGWEQLIAKAVDIGARRFVLNIIWQRAAFPENGGPAHHFDGGFDLWAGPFCNLANPLALARAASMGFRGAILSPELGEADILALPGQSPLPLGIVIDGNWPLCLSRIQPEGVESGETFFSPKGEGAWIKPYGQTVWMYPDWRLNLNEKKRELREAGYRTFVHLNEPLPRPVQLKQRPGLWNWSVDLA